MLMKCRHVVLIADRLPHYVLYLTLLALRNDLSLVRHLFSVRRPMTSIMQRRVKLPLLPMKKASIRDDLLPAPCMEGVLVC